MSTETMNAGQATAVDPWEMKVGGSGGGEYRLAPSGNQLARISGLFDIGTHRREYKGQVSESRQLVLVFQLAKRDEAGNNFILGERYTWSLNVGKGQKSKFRVLVESITGKDFGEGDTFDPRTLVGMTVLVNVVHDRNGEKTYHNVGGVGPKPDFADEPADGTFKYPNLMWTVMGKDGFPDHHNEWLPYIYGKSIQELAKASNEATGGGSSYMPSDSGAASPGQPPRVAPGGANFDETAGDPVSMEV